ncbi:MAG: helix-turn-helix domain-containing protein [Ruminococcaceae bacterium]|nr:helix-turn-helix domain-containing protein [Oscillospiraceae bacterium]
MKTVIYQEDFDYPETQMHFHLFCQDYPELHDHNYWEFFFVVGGSVTHVTEKGEQVLTEGMGYLIHPSDCHYFTEASDDYAQLNVMISDAYFRELLGFVDENLYQNINAVKNPMFYMVGSSVSREMQKTLHAIQITNVANQKRITALTKLMWLEVIKLIYRKDPVLNQVYPEWLNNFINEIQKPQNIGRKASELTELTHFSHRHLTRLFLRHTGQTLNEYLLVARMNYAAMLLRTTQQDILQISASVGYDSLSHFIRIFKAHFKTTPKQYRMTYHNQKEEF